MTKRWTFILAPWLLALAGACDSDSDTTNTPDTTKPAGASGASKPDSNAAGSGAKTAPGMANQAEDKAMTDANGDEVDWKTDDFMVDVGQERYLCFAKTLTEDLVVNGYTSNPKPFVHHLLFVRTRAPEPEGFAECNVAFRDTWDTVYASGAGANKLDLPSDAGHKFPKGTQLLVQMHLLNAGDEAVNGSVMIQMRRSKVANPRPVNTYVFGSAAVKLPAHQVSEVVGDCKVRDSVELIAGLPHMHRLGQAMHFEVGTDAGSMKEAFKRDPFTFDDQHIDMIDLKLNAGDMTRVTCTFNNSTSDEVTYGESTTNEMCYFVAFALDRGGACVASPPRR